MVKDMNDSLFRENIYDFDKGEDAKLLITKDTIIEFWATWCPHCKAMIPRYEAVSEKYPDIDCYRIDIEKYPGIAKLFNVDSFPTFIFIRKDQQIDKWVGEVPEEELEDMVVKNFELKK